jgi:hypothetical protein
MAYPLGTAYSGSDPSTAYAGTFIPEIWSSKLIQKFYDATVLAAISNTDYEGEIKNHGDKVIMRQRPTITIRDYSANQDLLVDRPSAPTIEMDIDKGKYFNLHLDDVMKVQMDVDMMNQWSADASEQMKIVIDRDVLKHLVNQCVAANRGASAGRITGAINLGTSGTGSAAGTPVSLSKTNIMDYIILMGQVLDEQNIPEQGRWIVFPAWACSLLKRSELRDASLTGDGTSVMRNGRLGMIDRFTIFSSNLLPTSNTDGIGNDDGDGTEPDNDADAATYIYAGHKSALTFASQLTKLETIRSERTFGNLMRGLQVFGRKVVDGTALCQLVAKPASGIFAPS